MKKENFIFNKEIILIERTNKKILFLIKPNIFNK